MKYRVLVNDKEVAIIEAEGTAFSLGISPVIEEVPEKKSLAQEIAGTKLINANWSNTGIYLSADSAQKIVDLVLTRFDEAEREWCASHAETTTVRDRLLFGFVKSFLVEGQK